VGTKHVLAYRAGVLFVPCSVDVEIEELREPHEEALHPRPQLRVVPAPTEFVTILVVASSSPDGAAPSPLHDELVDVGAPVLRVGGGHFQHARDRLLLSRPRECRVQQRVVEIEHQRQLAAAGAAVSEKHPSS